MRRTFLLFLFLVSGFLFAAAVHACSVPVFRYALERWEPDPYEAIVFHRGDLTAQERTLVEQLRKGSTPPSSANLTLEVVDVSQPLAEDIKKIWDAERSAELPRLVARYPGSSDKAYAGPLRRDTVQAFLDSPIRREVQKRILAGESAVFVLLESGQRAQDDAAAQLLERQLKKLEATLKLPEAADEIAREILENRNAPELKIAFSMIRLSRKDVAESVFAEILLNTESDLKKYDAPMVFPIFGRGRVFEALVGKGITEQNIHEVCAFIIGPCSCEVKRINPGRDLIMAVDWTKTIGSAPPRERRTAGPLLKDAPLASRVETTSKHQGSDATPLPEKPPVAAEDDARITDLDESSHAIRNGLFVLAALVGVSLLIMFRR